jgi:ADP-ribosyl-[dinitrogen reductase] hydrolase
MFTLDRFCGSLLGLAVGDAVGTAVEFRPRGSFQKVVDMTGGGPFGLRPGQWTDDTSMALCLATSLITKKGFDPIDQMDRYLNWYQNGYLSSTGRCFDIGNTVRYALDRYHRTGEPFSGNTSSNAAGNGSLMRLAPIPIYYFPDLENSLYFASESSRTTHGAVECLEACQLFAEILFNAFSDKDKEICLFNTTFKPATPTIGSITLGEYRNKKMSEIKGSGYVVSSLEAALWCFYHTDSFEDAILVSANLGDDADTTAAICGQIAGAYYGVNAIPERWLAKLMMRDEIVALVKELAS